MSGMPLTPEMVEAHLEDEVDDFPTKRIPTGVSDLDTIVKGGLPSGSVVLLLGDVGAGQREYVYTSASKIAIVTENPHLKKFYLGSAGENGLLPKNIRYISFTRSKKDILKEVALSFNPQFVEAMERLTTFKDFSGEYFKRTVVPQSWTNTEDENPFSGQSGGLLEKLVTYLDDKAKDSVVVVDSITDLVESEEVSKDDLIATMKGLQRAAKNWNGIVYLLLTQGIMETRYQQMLMDSVDGVLTFQWRNYLNSSKRQRYMYVEKFIGLLPHLENERMSRFPTMVTNHQGLSILYMERII